MPASIFHRLDQEWAELVSSPVGRRALGRWAAAETALAGHADLEAVLASRRHSDRCHKVLRALAERAPTDDVAARTLLQAMIPGLVRLARTAGLDDPVVGDELVALAWERIRTYPAQRTGSVAANILFDVRKRYRQHRRVERPDSAELPRNACAEGSSPEDQVLGRLLIGDLAAAVDSGVVSGAAMAVIIRSRLAGERVTDLAAEQGVTPGLLRQRRWRDEQRLRSLPLAG